MRTLTLTLAAALGIASIGFAAGPALAQAAATAEKPELTASGHYSVQATKAGFLIDDPAAAAILEKIIPSVYGNDMFRSMGRDQTLAGIQQYEPVALSAENLAKIQAEFDKLPPKK